MMDIRRKVTEMILRGAGVNIVRGVAGAGVLTSFDRYVTTITFF